MIEMILTKKRFQGLILLAASLSAIALFYLPIAHRWFFSDDIQWLWSSATHQFTEMFFSPEKYRSMASNFTPMLGASFRIDWLLFKMNPLGYSIHSLVSLIATAAALYFFLRFYARRNTAIFGVLIFLLNPITLVVTNWLSTRHYMEGLFCALLSLTFFLNGKRKDKISVASGVWYILASLNKEVFVVLPAIAFVLSKEGPSRRIKHTLPFWLGLVIYAVWRLWIMGGIGGYPSNQALSFSSVLPLLYLIIGYYSLHLLGGYPVLFCLLLSPVLILSLRRIGFFFIFLLLLAPILPVSNILSGDHYIGRYFFHISIFQICAACAILDHFTEKRKMLGYGVFLICLLVIAAFAKRDFELSKSLEIERIEAKETAMEFVSSGEKYMRAAQPSWFYEGLRKINAKFFGRDIGIQIVPESALLDYASPEKLKEILESGISIPYDKILSSRKRFRKGPLTVLIIVDDYKLMWDFGPDKHRMYTVLRSPVSSLYYSKSVLPASGSFMLGQSDQKAPDVVYIKVLYNREGGDVVESPEFVLKIPGKQKIEFASP